MSWLASWMPKRNARVKNSHVGLWSSRRGLVAIIVDPDDHQGLPLRVARTDEAAFALLAYLESAHRGARFELVLPDHLAKASEIVRVGLECGVATWLVPDPLIDGIRTAARLTAAPPQRTAAALARIPRSRIFREQLLLVAPGERPADRRQLTLW